MKKKVIGAILTISLAISSNFVCYANFEPISKGASGDIVYEVQELLKQHGYLAGTVDGIFGNGTYEAVSAFQQDNGLEVTGVIGESTYKAIKEYSGTPQTDITTAETENTDATDKNISAEISSNSNSIIIESDNDLEITKTGYSICDGYINYGIVLHNNSDKNAVLFPGYKLTARSENREVLGTTEQILNIIYPGQDYIWAGLGFDVPEMPANVEFQIIDPEAFNIEAASLLEHPKYLPLEAKGINCRSDEFMGYTFTGEIYNPNDYKISSVCIFVVLKDEEGAILGGEMTFADDLDAKGTVPFELYLYEDIEFSDYDIYANSWE